MGIIAIILVIVESNNHKKMRVYQLDWIRTAAIACVILCHVTELVYGGDALSFASMPIRSRLVAFSFFCIGRLGVPLFLFLSGYLLLKKEYNIEGVKHFYKNNLLPLLFIWMLWSVFYNVYNFAVRGIPLSFEEIASNVFFLKMVDMPHSWYMPMIIGLYIFIPYVANILQKLGSKGILCLLSLLFLNYFIIPFVKFYAGDNAIYINGLFDLSFGGGIYGCYIILGYCVYRYRKILQVIFSQKLFTLFWCLLIVLVFILQIVIGCIYSKNGYILWYDSPLIILDGFLIFVFIFTRVSNRENHNVSYMLSSQSFGVFLLHVMPLYLFQNTSYWSHSRWLFCVGLTFAIFVFCNLCIWVTSKVSPRVCYNLYLLKT